MIDDKKTPQVQRDVRVPLMMTAEERERLRVAANRAGLTLSAYIRSKALEAAGDG